MIDNRDGRFSFGRKQPHLAKQTDRWSRTVVLGVLFGILNAGCGGGTNTFATILVKGKVTYKGQPLTNGTVTFSPVDSQKCRPATGQIESDGTFVMSTVKFGDGVMPGEYKVAIESLKAGSDEDEKRETGQDSGIPKKYTSFTTSELQETVSESEGNKTVEYNLEGDI